MGRAPRSPRKELAGATARARIGADLSEEREALRVGEKEAERVAGGCASEATGCLCYHTYQITYGEIFVK